MLQLLKAFVVREEGTMVFSFEYCKISISKLATRVIRTLLMCSSIRIL